MNSSGRWRLIGVVAAVTVLALGFGVWIKLYQAAVPAWRVLSDDSGRIVHVACVINSARRAALRNAALVTRILNSLPRRTRVTVLTNDPKAFAVLGDPQRGRLVMLDLPAASDFTIWPQDPFLVLKSRDGRLALLAAREFDRVDDRLIPQRLAKHLHTVFRKSKLAFEGGNVVVGSRHVFVGADTIRYNAVKLRKTDPDVVKAFQRELGRPVLVIGPVPQVVGHIDMMLTPIDGISIGVADPRWGAALVRRELTRNPAAVRAFEQRCEDYYFGNPHVHALRDAKGRLIKPPKVVGKTEAAVKDSQAIAVHLDRVAEELTRYGYRVRRFPFLMSRPKPVAKSTTGSKAAEPGPGYPCLTYNNVLVEHESGRRTVYLPQYGLGALDRAARAAWRRAGCRVVPIEGFAISAMYGGSLRCCVKVLDRD